MKYEAGAYVIVISTKTAFKWCPICGF